MNFRLSFVDDYDLFELLLVITYVLLFFCFLIFVCLRRVAALTQTHTHNTRR